MSGQKISSETIITWKLLRPTLCGLAINLSAATSARQIVRLAG
ncbi:MAG: hypothetical protein ACI9US_004575 [Gammaproteobacteria bacterium]|jgi:hypothetical protein